MGKDDDIEGDKSSKHRVQRFHTSTTYDQEEEEEEDDVEEVRIDKCEGAFNDSCYPVPPVLEEEEPDDLPRAEVQEEPQEMHWCPACKKSPCVFLEWQEELERCVDLMAPEVTNKSKRYHMYRHMSRRLNGQMGKGNRKQLPQCFERGLRELYPSEEYSGFKANSFDSGPRGDYDREKDDGSTYN